MSIETVTCEGCGAAGARPLTHYAPVEWLYIETRVDGTTCITYACSGRCAEGLWKIGPGPQLPGVGAAVNEAIRRKAAGISHVAPLAQLEARVRQLEAAVKPRSCIFDEGTCKAADCPEHGWSRSGQGDG